MAQYTFEVFKWSGNGYNSQYNDSQTATITDDDANFEGSGDIDEKISVDGGADQSSSGPPYSIDVSFTDTSGQPHVETFEFFNTGGSWYFIPGPGSEFSVGAKLGNYQSHTVGWSYDDTACFCAGMLIETAQGPVAVEDQNEGTLIQTLDGPPAPLKKRLKRHLTAVDLIKSPKLRPIVIAEGAQGNHLPHADLYVSPQHRMLVPSKAALRMFDQSEVLIAAHRLIGHGSIYRDTARVTVDYFHLVFEDHKVIFANGAPSESFYPGKQALNALSQKARQEFLALFPRYAKTASPARFAKHVPSNKRQRKLVERHIKNSQPLLA